MGGGTSSSEKGSAGATPLIKSLKIYGSYWQPHIVTGSNPRVDALKEFLSFLLKELLFFLIRTVRALGARTAKRPNIPLYHILKLKVN